MRSVDILAFSHLSFCFTHMGWYSGFWSKQVFKVFTVQKAATHINIISGLFYLVLILPIVDTALCSTRMSIACRPKKFDILLQHETSRARLLS